MELVVHPAHRIIKVEAGANLLEVLKAHQVPVSYSCMAGRCGVCRCKVLRGQVMNSGPESRTAVGNGDGYVLACQTALIEDCAIEIPEPDEVVVHPARIVKATVTEFRSMSHDVMRLRLKPAKPIAFSPGQYATLQFSPNHIRPYSMAGLDGDEELEFHIRVVAGGRVTAHISNSLKVGDSVRVSGPLGSAYLRRKHEGKMLCVAGGTGLAPALSIIRGALAAGMSNPIHLYFGANRPEDLYGLEWLADLAAAHSNLSVQTVVVAGSQSAAMRPGLVTDAIANDLDSLAGWRAYLCGSPGMVEAASLLVRRKGLAAEHMYADAFYSTGT